MCFGVRTASAHCLRFHAEDEQHPCERLVLSLGRERCPLDIFLCESFHWKTVTTDQPCTKCAPDLEFLLPIVVKLQRDARLYLLRKQVSKKHKREPERVVVPAADQRLQIIPIPRYRRVDFSFDRLMTVLLGEKSAAAGKFPRHYPYPEPSLIRAHIKFTSPIPLPIRPAPEQAHRRTRRPESRYHDSSTGHRSYRDIDLESNKDPHETVYNSNPAPAQFSGNKTSPIQRYPDSRWLDDSKETRFDRSSGEFIDSDDEDIPLVQVMKRMRLTQAAEDTA